MTQEAPPTRLVVFGTLADPEDLTIAFRGHADHDEQRGRLELLSDFKRH